MSATSLRLGLPPVYHRLLPAIFDVAAPAEEKATCSSCAMCPPAGADVPSGVEYFRPDTKCCTYHPTIPNYLVGALFDDADPSLAEGQRRMRERISMRIGVSPRWVAATRKFRLLFEASRERAFGRSLLLRCPYFIVEGGLCAIWRHRESACSTFFCKYDGGADGQTFWRALAAYLVRVETVLSRHALDEVAPEIVLLDDPPGLSLEELEDRAPDPARHDASFGSFAGREEELFRRCHQVVAALGPDALPALMGPSHDELLERLSDAHRRAEAPSLPAHLVLAPDLPLNLVEGGAIAVGYSRYEPIFLSDALLEVLRGLAADEALKEAQLRVLRDSGAELPSALLLSLHRARILIEP